MEQSHSWDAISSEAIQEISRIVWNPKEYYRAHKRPLRYSILSQINPFLILSSHLSLGLPSGLFSSNLRTQTLYAHVLSPIRPTCPTPLILLDFITRIICGEEYRPYSCSLCNIFHSRATSSHLNPHIFLSTLLSNPLSLRSSFNIRDHVPQPYKTTGKIIVPHILTFMLLERKVEDKRFWAESWKTFPDFSLLLNSPWMRFCVSVVPNYVNFATISNIHYPFLCCAFTLHAALEIRTHKMTAFFVQSCDGNPP